MAVLLFDSRKIIADHLESLKSYIQFQMEAYGRNASHDHVNSLNVEASAGYGVLTGLRSWNFMETGRGGGKVPRHFRLIIYQWSIDKGIQINPIPYVRGGKHKYTPEERGRLKFAGAVAFRIMKSGTSLYRSGIREDIYSSAINREVSAILQESTLKVGEIITNLNKNAL